MSWISEIKEKYPKAFRLWLDSEDYKAEPVVVEYSRESKDIYLADANNQTTFLCELRDLYDFFDEQGITISIDWVMHPFVDKLEYYYDFAIDNVAAFESKKHYQTRTEAEEKAFEKAFEILESKGE